MGWAGAVILIMAIVIFAPAASHAAEKSFVRFVVPMRPARVLIRMPGP